MKTWGLEAGTMADGPEREAYGVKYAEVWAEERWILSAALAPVFHMRHEDLKNVVEPTAENNYATPPSYDGHRSIEVVPQMFM